MTVCGKSNENNSNMNAQSRNLVANRPSFMITDILSKAAVEKAPTTAQNTEYLQHLERFSAMNHHAFGMMMPGQMPTAERKDTSFCDSDDDDFHGSDDVDGQSTDGSNRKFWIFLLLQFLEIFSIQFEKTWKQLELLWNLV